MKKILSLFAILMMVTTSWAEDVEVTTWAEIQTYLKSSDNSSKVCKLMNDIDFGGGTIERLDKDISQDLDNTLGFFTIDGNGHTIKNGTIKENALLLLAEGGTIKNLKFDNIKSTGKSILIKIAKNSFTCDNLSFNNCSITNDGITGLVCAATQIYDKNHTEISYHFSNITVTNCLINSNSYFSLGNEYYCTGAILGDAKYSSIYNCNVSNTNINGIRDVGGLIGSAYNCAVSDCSFRGKIYADGYGNNARAGGIVGYSVSGGTITNCQNHGEIEADDDQIGGIAGYAVANNIENCKNTGWIHHKNLTGSDDEIGGIVGTGSNLKISKCINEGSVDGGDAHAGGIVGYLEGYSSVTHCVNGGFVNGKSYIGGIAGQTKDQTKVSYCIGASNRIEGGECTQLLVGAEPSGSTSNNYWISETSDIENGAVTAADLKSGKLAFIINNKVNSNIWGQGLTNQGEGIDDYPTPGGKTVYKHTTNCKNETCEFYNNYNDHDHYGDIVQNSAGHYNCTYCNQEVTNGADYVTGFTILDAQDLAKFAAFVNAGHPLVKAHLYDDIDCTSLTSYTPIGTQTHTYCGTFDGGGCRIKNLKVNSAQDGLGLFGYLGHGAIIKDVIIDESCYFMGVSESNTQKGIAGIAGCVYAPTEQNPVNVSFVNCGNEAPISGFSNVGGILGGVYNNNNIHVSINRCYNTGAINAGETSAALAGWLYKNFEIKDCWNSGTVTHQSANSDKLVYRRADDASLTNVSNVYSTVAQEDEGVTTIRAADVTTGRLCYLLNGSTNSGSNMVWGQELETEKHPTFSTVGVTYKRTMTNQWGTICLPYDVTYSQSNSDYKLYKLSATSIDGNNGTLTFIEYLDGTIAAGTPMVVKSLGSDGIEIVPASTPNFSADITTQNSTNASLPSGWTMNGTYTSLSNQAGIYFVAQDKFWYAESPITIAPFRAWFAGPTQSSAKTFSIVIDDETNSINQISHLGESEGTVKFLENGKVVIVKRSAGTDACQSKNGRKYNLNGQAIQ